MRNVLHRAALLCAALLLAGCAAAPVERDPAVSQSEIRALASAFEGLSPAVDPEEAARAARIAITYPLELRALYEVEDGPVLHNTKVNAGLKPRGLCWHWAQDMERRMRQEDFETLALHRAVAPPRNLFRLEHSTLVISANGETMQEGLVLDPWRKGGVLYWAPVPEDPSYDWLPRAVVLASKGYRIPDGASDTLVRVADGAL
ncbi:hypothetical protein SAMN05421759_104244 [Roseivivax lentus]|uniref:Lipoprotein n=1 Tax=Roseivivax lentus TaxID=633194 RepID=A0A1N7MED9_9RHOB|nr:hypothetical protein [Roseivivax lentus]SIS84417.1 hypothetical protein SAMN05421759_104244 [Roseivivax lentus]